MLRFRGKEPTWKQKTRRTKSRSDGDRSSSSHSDSSSDLVVPLAQPRILKKMLRTDCFFPFPTSAFPRSHSRVFMEKRMAQEVSADSLGDEWKGYVFRITGGNDKQGELRTPARQV